MDENSLLFKIFLICLIVNIGIGLITCAADTPRKCGSLSIKCPLSKHVTSVCSNCQLTSQEERQGILYFTFYDCSDNQSYQSSTDTQCEFIIGGR